MSFDERGRANFIGNLKLPSAIWLSVIRSHQLDGWRSVLLLYAKAIESFPQEQAPDWLFIEAKAIATEERTINYKEQIVYWETFWRDDASENLRKIYDSFRL